MKNFAKINWDNTVHSVIVSNESYLRELDGYFVEVTEETGWAGPNSIYSPVKGKFLDGKPFESWTLNEEDFKWEAPKPKPDTGKFIWSEAEQEWIEVISEPSEE